MARRTMADQSFPSAKASHARSTASASAAADTGENWKPVAAPALSAASLASITVSARPPVRATTGRVP